MADQESSRIEVLIADDSEVERLYLRRSLEKLGIRPDEAGDGRECIRKAGEKEYDLLLVDLLMPGMSGIRTLREVRSTQGLLNRNTPAVALGSEEDCAREEDFAEGGFADCLEKPVRLQLLAAALFHCLPEEKADRLRGSGVADPRQGAEESAPEKPQAAGAGISKAAPQGALAGSSARGAEDELPDWVYAAEGIDVKEGISHCGSGEGFLAALEIFHSTIAKKAEEIRGYLEAEDWKNYTIKVHALKSSARIIGASTLSERAKALEDAGNALDLEQIRRDTGPMLAQYEAYRKTLDPIAGDAGAEDADKPEAPADQLADAYAALAEYIDSMDYELTEMVLKSMGEYRLPEPHSARFEALNAKLLELDWDGMKALVQEAQG